MERALARIDRALSATLIVLVAAMVLSVTAEVVLNAVVQPLASRLLRAADRAVRGPADSDPVDADPVDADPVDADPVDADPVDSDPVDADPVDADPVDSDPVDGGPDLRAPPPAGSPFLQAVVRGASRLSAPLNTASQVLLVWVGILGSALALRLRAHIGVDALVRLYPPRVRILLDRLSTALVAAFSLAVLVVGGWTLCARAFASGSRMPGLDAMNHGWFYLVLVLTGAVNLLTCLGRLFRPPPGDGGLG